MYMVRSAVASLVGWRVDVKLKAPVTTNRGRQAATLSSELSGKPLADLYDPTAPDHLADRPRAMPRARNLLLHRPRLLARANYCHANAHVKHLIQFQFRHAALLLD